MAEYEGEGTLLPSAAVERLPTGELMSRVELAKRFPRKIQDFQKKLEAMVTSSQEVAQSTFYKLRRKKKDGTFQIIEGPSIRFMEMVAPCYQHLRWLGKMVAVEEDCVVSQAYCHDMENDLEVGVEVRRPIKSRGGGRYTDDMINVTAMAGVAIAMRNALGKVVPRPLWEPAFLKAKTKAIGTTRSLPERRQACVTAFGQMGVTVEELLAYVEKAKIEEMTSEDIETLLGTFTAIKDEGASIDELFGRTKAPMAEPMSNAEAAAQGAPVTKGGPLEAALGGGQAEPSLEQEAREREQAEAAGEKTPPPPKQKKSDPPPAKVNVAALFEKVKARAAKERKPGAVVLRELTGKSNMTDLTDGELADLAKKLK